MIISNYLSKKEDGNIKRIWFFSRDGRNGPHFPSTCKALIKFFKENDIDFMIAACNNSGLSAYHFIETRMELLFKELDGLILLHNYFGTHLHGNGNTRNSKISKRLETYCKIWSNVVDGYPVCVSCVDLSQKASNFKEFAENKLKSWFEEQYCNLKIQYCLQISKCKNDECCKPLRTNAHGLLHSRSLTTPMILNSAPSLLDPTDKSEKCITRFALCHLRLTGYTRSDLVPYDLLSKRSNK